MHSPVMTFAEYTQSTKTASALAEYFLRCYERPEDVVESSQSSSNSNKWKSLIIARKNLLLLRQDRK